MKTLETIKNLGKQGIGYISDLTHFVTKKVQSLNAQKVKELNDIDAQLDKQQQLEHIQPTDIMGSFNSKKFWLTGVVIVGLALLIYKAYSFIYLIIAAFIIAMAIENLVLFFQRFMKRGFALGVAYMILVLFVLSGILVLIPFVITQLIDLVSVVLTQLNERQTTLQAQGLTSAIEGSSLPNKMKEWMMTFAGDSGIAVALQGLLLENMDQIVSAGTSSIKDASGLAVGVISGFFAAAIKVAITFVLSVFFSIEKNKVIHFIGNISTHTARTELVLKKLYRKLGSWLEGQLVLCISIGVMVLIGLNILSWIGFDLPNKATLALIAGLLEFIPYLGPIMGMLPALIVAVTQYGIGGLFATWIVYVLIQQLENNVLVPMVMYHALGTSPLVVLLCVVVGGTLFGILGVLLAVPIAVILSILYETYSK